MVRTKAVFCLGTVIYERGTFTVSRRHSYVIGRKEYLFLYIAGIYHSLVHTAMFAYIPEET